MKEEDNILKKVGKENAFRVPDGYFENLTSEVMNKLPEKENQASIFREPTRWERIKPWLYMAAMFAGAALIIRTASFNPSSEADTIAMEDSETELISDEYINTVVEGSMLDDYSLYIYVTDAGVDW